MAAKTAALHNLKLALATFIAGATAAPAASPLFGVDMWKAAAMAGVTAVWQFAAKWAIDVQRANRHLEQPDGPDA